METRVQPFTDQGIADAARLILAGDPVAVPTETVYGLAADATNAEAVARIYEAKGRPTFNPLIVHAFDLQQALSIADFGSLSISLAKEHWPGPLTLVVLLREDAGIAPLLTAGLPTVVASPMTWWRRLPQKLHRRWARVSGTLCSGPRAVSVA